MGSPKHRVAKKSVFFITDLILAYSILFVKPNENFATLEFPSFYVAITKVRQENVVESMKVRQENVVKTPKVRQENVGESTKVRQENVNYA